MPLDTDWQVIQTAAAGLRAQGPHDTIQFFRVRRIDHTVIVDLSGLELAAGAGRANLGTLPDWARPVLPQQYHWVNDHATSLHASVCAVHCGKTLYWEGQVQEGRVVVNRPGLLRGGFEYTTAAPFPHHLVTKPSKEKPRWMP